MKHPKNIRERGRKRRAKRVRKKVTGTAERPRISVSRSLKNVYVQVIDDVNGVSILGISSQSPEIASKEIEGGKIEISKAVGKIVAEKALEKGVKEVVFDRSGYLYHGRIKAVAEGAREGGLSF